MKKILVLKILHLFVKYFQNEAFDSTTYGKEVCAHFFEILLFFAEYYMNVTLTAKCYINHQVEQLYAGIWMTHYSLIPYNAFLLQ